MRGHIRRRGDPGRWEYLLDVGMATAQRCQSCGQRFWMERKPKAECPKCAGMLIETEERRRKTQAGFATRKECEVAMNKVMTAVEERTYVVPSRITVREFLLREWLPAIKGTVRPTTYASYTMHVEGHIVPALGSLQIARLTAQSINAFYAQLLQDGRASGQGGLSPATVRRAYMPPCTERSKTRSVGVGCRSTPSMPPIRPEAKQSSAICRPGRGSSWRASLRT
jgi:predicted RNA-binding Zn-ribbon protein involved in translation (DUF1610 family)